MKQFLLFLFVTLVSLSYVSGSSEVALFPPSNTEPEISIFPNPATNYFEIQNSDQVNQVVIYNMLGSKIKAFNAQENNHYDVMDIPHGMYLVQFLDEYQAVVATRRLRKE